jgi:site-specific recombinase XerD
MRVPNRATRQRRLAGIKAFFRHLEITLRLDNPTRRMRLPKRDQRLPSVLDEKEIEQLIGKERPEDNDRTGWRDRALVETLYSCGLRGGEAVALDWTDIDAEMAMVRILHGKGDKFRLVPIGEVALDALDRWRRLTRSGGSDQAVFINWCVAPTCARFRRCSAMPACRRHKSTRTWTLSVSSGYTIGHIPGLDIRLILRGVSLTLGEGDPFEGLAYL